MNDEIRIPMARVEELIELLLPSSYSTTSFRYRKESRGRLIKYLLKKAVQNDITQEIEDLLQSGKKIGAVIAYRKFYGTGLKDAKDEVEAIELRMKKAGNS